MAQITMVLIAETELAHDAIADVSRIHHALASRHGDRFRKLERRIDALTDDIGDCDLISIGDGRMVMTVPSRIAAVLAEAKALGVQVR